MFIAFIAGFTLIRFFFPGWAGFGVMFWISPLLFAVGALAGFLLVLWWTRPPETLARTSRDERQGERG
jgi:hypothetical protein